MKSKLRYFFIFIFSANQMVASEYKDHSDYNVSDGRVAMIQGCVELVVSIVQHGYEFFKRDAHEYDFQVDVVDNPYKNMVYTCTQDIDRLFDDATAYDNPLRQIRALILLCRMPVPEWYFKSYCKGVDALYQICFDEQGNFNDTSGLGDIRLIFKDYCKKSPASWQDVAKISEWWYKNKKSYPLYSPRYAGTCTDFNEDLLSMIEADQLENLVYLKYLLSKNDAKVAHKIYDYQISKFLKQ